MTAATQVARGAEAKAPKAEGAANMRGDAFISRPGSDFMVDVIKTPHIDYVASNPASSFRSLHESIVNYGGNKRPEFLTCMHEESSVAIAHGYAKAAGKPMAVLCHSSVGLQHASMAIYNAWVDRAPILMFAGNGVDAAKRRPWRRVDALRSGPGGDGARFRQVGRPARIAAALRESTVRAYRMMMSPPQDPVLITLDIDLQESPIEEEKLTIPSSRSPRLRRRTSARCARPRRC